MLVKLRVHRKNKGKKSDTEEVEIELCPDLTNHFIPYFVLVLCMDTIIPIFQGAAKQIIEDTFP